MAHELEFGFRPLALDVTIGPVTIETLGNYEDQVAKVEQSKQLYREWIYAPRQLMKNNGSGETYPLPFAQRVFSLPNTHVIRHVEDVELGHLQFHIWSLGFFTGQRLSAAEAGFLDVTPFKPGKLNDFVILGDNLSKAVQLAEEYWQGNVREGKQLARFEAAVHALFLAQNPRLLQSEAFIFLYTALDACFAIMKDVFSEPYQRHQQRIRWMCERYSVPVPDWAVPVGGAEIAVLRNRAIHEGLYMEEPLGFAIEGTGSNRNLNLQMQAVVCRLLVGIIGGAEADYVKSAVTSRQNFDLILP